MNFKQTFLLFAALFLCCSNCQIEAAILRPTLQKLRRVGQGSLLWQGYEGQVGNKDQLKEWFAAAREGNLEIIQKLIGKVDVNAQEDEVGGFTALMLASSYNHENIVRILLKFLL